MEHERLLALYCKTPTTDAEKMAYLVDQLLTALRGEEKRSKIRGDMVEALKEQVRNQSLQITNLQKTLWGSK